MGARVYIPTTGAFLQTDPKPGADANAYGYADGDPVNNADLSGAKHHKRSSTTFDITIVAPTEHLSDWFAGQAAQLEGAANDAKLSPAVQSAAAQGANYIEALQTQAASLEHASAALGIGSLILSIPIQVAGGESALQSGLEAAFSYGLGAAGVEAFTQVADCAEDGEAGAVVCGVMALVGGYVAGNLGDAIADNLYGAIEEAATVDPQCSGGGSQCIA